MDQLASFAIYLVAITSISFILAISLDLQVGNCGIILFLRLFRFDLGPQRVGSRFFSTRISAEVHQWNLHRNARSKVVGREWPREE